MITSQGIKFATPTRAARVQAGRWYHQQNQSDQAFKVLVISDGYLRNSIAAYRVAIVRDRAAGRTMEDVS
jgi:hypothetical protein